MAAFKGDWEALGLPSIPPEVKTPACSSFESLRACTRQGKAAQNCLCCCVLWLKDKDLLNAYQHRRPPVYPPHQSPVYSNSGTSLVGLVVEAASNRTFETVVRDRILNPLGMQHPTIATKPENVHNMFIPIGSTDWDRDLGVFAP